MITTTGDSMEEGDGVNSTVSDEPVVPIDLKTMKFLY